MVRFLFVEIPSGWCEGNRLLSAGWVGSHRKRWGEVHEGILDGVQWETEVDFRQRMDSVAYWTEGDRK